MQGASIKQQQKTFFTRGEILFCDYKDNNICFQLFGSKWQYASDSDTRAPPVDIKGSGKIIWKGISPTETTPIFPQRGHNFETIDS